MVSQDTVLIELVTNYGRKLDHLKEDLLREDRPKEDHLREDHPREDHLREDHPREDLTNVTVVKLHTKQAVL